MKINLINLDKIAKMLLESENVSEEFDLENVISEELGDVLEQEKQKRRAPRKGYIRYFRYMPHVIQVVVDGWQPVEGDIIVDVDKYKENDALTKYLESETNIPPFERPALVEPGAQLRLIIKNTYLYSRKRSQSTKLIKSRRHGFGVRSSRYLKSRSLRRNVKKGLRFGDYFISNYTEKWSGAETLYKGANPGWKRWVFEALVKLNWSKDVPRVNTSQYTLDNIKDPVCIVDLEPDPFADEGVVSIQTHWVDRSVLQAAVSKFGNEAETTKSSEPAEENVDCDALSWKPNITAANADHNARLCAENPSCRDSEVCKGARERLNPVNYDHLMNTADKKK